MEKWKEIVADFLINKMNSNELKIKYGLPISTINYIMSKHLKNLKIKDVILETEFQTTIIEKNDLGLISLKFKKYNQSECFTAIFTDEEIIKLINSLKLKIHDRSKNN